MPTQRYSALPEVIACARRGLLAPSSSRLPLVELANLFRRRRLICILIVPDLDEPREP